MTYSLCIAVIITWISILFHVNYNLFVLFNQVQIQKCDKSVQDHQDHHDALQASVDWLTLMKDRLSTCSDTAGDRHTLQNKLDRVKVYAYS